LRTIAHPAARVEVFDDARDACRAAADRIATTIGHAVAARGRAAIGLATGATPVLVYADLVARHRAGSLSFRDVATYNLDEYYPISPCDPRSYRMFMYKHLFSHVDLPANRAHVLDGSVPEGAVGAHAKEFDRWIAADGGLDLQLLGIGRNGHIGFNEPMGLAEAEALGLPSRMIRLAAETRALYADEFGGLDGVPERALTVGVAPILAARSILVLAFGPAKAEPVARSLAGPMTAQIPGSLLQAAPGRVTWLLDPAAASRLQEVWSAE
jgi:glucosamine-6-phosphate deaminase